MTTTRPTILCGQEAVSSGHYLATLAGIEILASGGNAVDAGVAAGLALGVLESTYVSIGGVAPIVLRTAETGETITISGLGAWPRAASCAYFRDRHAGHIPPGVLRTVVPGAPAAWITALDRFGTLSFGEVAQAAIGYARDGFPAHSLLRETVSEAERDIRGWSSSAAIYLPGGAPPQVGQVFRQVDLAATLQFVADEERAGAGGGRAAGLGRARNVFYCGDIGRQMVRFLQAEGGLLDEVDLAGFDVEVEPAVHVRFRGVDIYGCGPWCQGPMLLQALKIIEALEIDAFAHNDSGYLHLLAEAIRLAARDRELYYGDPRWVDVPLGRLLSEGHGRELAGLIRPDRALPAWNASAGGTGTSVLERRLNLDTSFVSVVDRFGNAFAATPSDGCTAAPVVPGLGFVASPRGNQSWTDPAHPSAIAPGKRPRLTPNPAIAVAPGEFVMPFGTPGHDTQTQVMLQVLLNLLHFGMSPQDAVEAPRIASLDFPSSSSPHTARPGLLLVEAGMGERVVETLRALGHDARPWPLTGPEYLENLSAACLVRADLRTGVIAAAADPRRPAYAIGR